MTAATQIRRMGILRGYYTLTPGPELGSLRRYRYCYRTRALRRVAGEKNPGARRRLFDQDNVETLQRIPHACIYQLSAPIAL